MDDDRPGPLPATPPPPDVLHHSHPEATLGRPGEPARPSRRRPPRRTSRHGSLLRELPVLVVVALVLAFLLKTFLLQAFYIPSGSMQNTLLIGDRVLVNKVVYDLRPVRRGEVVVFNGLDSWTPEVTVPQPQGPLQSFLRAAGSVVGITPPGERDFIKRVIGIPGDRVQCCDPQGRVTVNGVPLDESSYLYPGNLPSDTPFDVTVPPGRLWVMGDHRAMSADSRSHLGDPGGGTIPLDRVIGQAFVVVWPPSQWRGLPVPATFGQPALRALAAAAPVAVAPAAAAPVAVSGAPLALGLVGAVPLVLVRRRRRARRWGRRR